MPFKSKAQRRFMYAKHPKLAKEFEAKTPKDKKLPEYAKKKKRKKKKTVKDSFERQLDDIVLMFEDEEGKNTKIAIGARMKPEEGASTGVNTGSVGKPEDKPKKKKKIS